MKIYVYFLECKSLEMIKIGHSWKPELRASRISRELGVSCTLVCKIPLESETEARIHERTLQHQFSKARLEGEWFRSNQEISDYIQELKNNGVSYG